MNKFRILIVVIVIFAVGAWLLSGILTQDPKEVLISLQEANELQRSRPIEREPTLVRGKRSTAIEQFKTIVVRGRTIDRNKATVPALTRGQVIARRVDVGDLVQQGDVLCEIDVEDRIARYESAKETLELAQSEYESTSRLTEEGFQQELDRERRQTQVTLYEQQLTTARIELENTKIKAPIDGVIDEVLANVGDFIDVGQPCVSILKLNPMYAQGYVAEHQVQALVLGNQAQVVLPNNDVRSGELSFISKKADSQTRTFRVEVTLNNEDYSIFSGASATIELIVDSQFAHKVPTSVIVMDESGSLGVKTVDQEDLVQTYPIDIVTEADDGVWVAGLPDVTTVITVGQGLVSDNERVIVDLE